MPIQPVERQKRKIYVASSWRNKIQPIIVQQLLNAGHEVYDFRNPAPGNTGFSWSQIDEDWQNWTSARFVLHVTASPIAQAGFKLDKAALDWCDTCVLVLPCGRSAHLEAGYAVGQGKDVVFYLVEEDFEPELMYELGHGYVFGPASLVQRMDEPIRRGNMAYQDAVWAWVREVHGDDLAMDMRERGDRFGEEAIELLEAVGHDRARVHALVDMVFDKGKPGVIGQEVGGVEVTLAGLCARYGLNKDHCAWAELARIQQPEIVEKCRAKQATKPTGDTLMFHYPADARFICAADVEAFQRGEKVWIGNMMFVPASDLVDPAKVPRAEDNFPDTLHTGD